MSQELAQSIRERIDRDWAEKDDVRALCRAILEFVIRPPKKALLTYTMLRNGAGPESSPAALAAAVEYLLGDVQVLELTFEFLGSDGFPVPISPQDAVAAHERRINPLTGDYQEDIESHLLTYFRPAGSLNHE